MFKKCAKKLEIELNTIFRIAGNDIQEFMLTERGLMVIHHDFRTGEETTFFDDDILLQLLAGEKLVLKAPAKGQTYYVPVIIYEEYTWQGNEIDRKRFADGLVCGSVSQANCLSRHMLRSAKYR